jgi:peptidoglycan/LPS O-acetylase OafA/YrhL
MRNKDFDILKCVAIIAVVLFHFGICKYGYLGVDVFFVIAGYFTAKSISKQMLNGGGI